MIPKKLHRTVPRVTTSEADRFWLAWQELNPGWEFHDWRDGTYDPNQFESSRLWGQCTSGAQMSGYLRLEVLLNYGGVYVDSDLEPVRRIDELLNPDIRCFAGWEDDNCIPDFVLGAEPGHHVIRQCLRKAMAMGPKAGAWKTGPGVTTSVFQAYQGTKGTVVFPRTTFAPFHYSVKETVTDADIEEIKRNPKVFGIHHWAHSWKGT